MAWNEPGNDKDPWSKNRGNNEGPPDFDEVIKGLQSKVNKIFGGGNKNGGNGESLTGLTIVIVVIAIFAWLFSGIYIVDEREQAVVFTFGEKVGVVGSGPKWIAPIIQTKEIVDVSSIRSTQNQGLILTEDENIVDVEFEIQYNVKDAADYVLNVVEPDDTLRQAAESALREVIGKNSMDYVITVGVNDIAARTKTVIQNMLNEYEAGIEVLTVNITNAQPPEQVQAAFADAIKAREDAERFINEAEAYRNEVVPLARGEATQQLERAKAYKAQVVDNAKGEANRFTQLLTEYQLAPEVTRERLYLDTLEDVLAVSNKVMIDGDNANNMMYLPLDQLRNNSREGRVSVSQQDSGDTVTTLPTTSNRNNRTRNSRL